MVLRARWIKSSSEKNTESQTLPPLQMNSLEGPVLSHAPGGCKQAASEQDVTAVPGQGCSGTYASVGVEKGWWKVPTERHVFPKVSLWLPASRGLRDRRHGFGLNYLCLSDLKCWSQSCLSWGCLSPSTYSIFLAQLTAVNSFLAPKVGKELEERCEGDSYHPLPAVRCRTKGSVWMDLHLPDTVFE